MLAVKQNTATTFILPEPLACLEDWPPLGFYLEFTNSQTQQTKGFLAVFSELVHGGYAFTFTEAPTDDLPNSTVTLGNVGDQWDLRLYQVHDLDFTAKQLYLERVQLYATI